ncbi:rab effector MyRIP isoform 1 [Cricetulus griseus]|uniref:Rab effector MyRIP isoform 1 n=1 Tax=Cricetulus griseus TaxID=10029 RepID=A0A061IAE9_CRIGR|nr:rab effector MyRIP isoform 1 [Cricetulus griseus]
MEVVGLSSRSESLRLGSAGAPLTTLQTLPGLSDRWLLSCSVHLQQLLRAPAAAAPCTCSSCSVHLQQLLRAPADAPLFTCIFSCRLLRTQSLEWFYSNVKSRFKRFGSAKVLKNLYRKHRLESGACFDILVLAPVLQSPDGNWMALKDDGTRPPSRLLVKPKSGTFQALEVASSVTSAYDEMGSDSEEDFDYKVLKVINATEELIAESAGPWEIPPVPTDRDMSMFPLGTDQVRLDKQLTSLEENVYLAAGTVYGLEGQLSELEDAARCIHSSTGETELADLEDQVAAAAAQVHHAELQCPESEAEKIEASSVTPIKAFNRNFLLQGSSENRPSEKQGDTKDVMNNSVFAYWVLTFPAVGLYTQPHIDDASILELTTFCGHISGYGDPFADATKGDDLLPAGTEDYIHIRIQQRNGRKTLTTVQGIADDYDKKKLVKAFKKKFACNGTVIEHPEYGEVIQLQGDQRKNICQFLLEVGIVKEEQLKVHGF